MRTLALALLLAGCASRPPVARPQAATPGPAGAAAAGQRAAATPASAPPAPAADVPGAGKKAARSAGGTPQAQGLISVGSWLPDPDEQKRVAAELLARARAAFDIGDHDGAAREAQASLYADPSAVAAATLLARAHVALGNAAKAEAVARGAIAMPGGDRQAALWMILGLAAERDGRIDEAVAAYEKATALDGDYAAAWTNLGALYLRQESLALAVDAFERVVRLRPRSAGAHGNLASALRARTADFVAEPQRIAPLLEQAVDEYAEALRLDPRHAPSVFNLALLHLDGDASARLSRAEQLEAAIQLFEKYQDLVKQSRRGGRAPAATPVDEYLALARSLLAKTAAP